MGPLVLALGLLIMVFNNCTATKTNHAVVVVGWGTENGVDYQLIKNSMGWKWGDYGYIKIKRGMCMTFSIISSIFLAFLQ